MSTAYQPILRSSDEDEDEKVEQVPWLWSRNVLVKTVTGLQVILCVSMFILGFFLGTLNSQVPDQKHLEGTVGQVPIGWVKSVFKFDETFATVPVKGESEAVWDGLIPNGLGYVKKAPLAPEFSVISVFHQLHCLYTIRRAYFSNATSGTEDFDFGRDRHEHTAHCFEYLRQSIMCSADSSVEPAGEHAGHGFLGWGFSRQCRNYEELKEWAANARAFDASGFLATELLNHTHKTLR